MNDQPGTDQVRASDGPEKAEKPRVDVSSLPALPPADSTAWHGSRRTGRWRGFGCGCGLVVLCAAMISAYLGLRQNVWSSFEQVRHGLQRSIAVEVEPEEKQRLLENLRLFGTTVSDRDDPYPAVGRFVSAGREVLVDFVVDPDETERLNLMLEKEMTE